MTNEAQRAALQQLPGVDRLLQDNQLASACDQAGRDVVVAAVRDVLAGQRRTILAGGNPPTTAHLISEVLRTVAERTQPTLRPIINATGVIIHTNLGRAPLSRAALAAMQAVGGGYSNLEFDLDAGTRGSRYSHVATLLAALSGAEGALVVNNNAAALFLILATFAASREVVISRAHLVEIGGGFRIPDILRRSGATLREVGTTNRTYVGDYEAAIGEATGLLLRVHSSNFLITGFVHQPELRELVDLARAHDLPLLDDLGSGALLDTRAFGLAAEPRVQASVAAGADLVCFSGDKLLGGPQAGCIVGRADLVARLRRHPLARALRVDKTTLAALDATLRAYQRGTVLDEIPVWQMIARPVDELEATVWAWASRLRAVSLPVEVLPGQSAVGGGSLPGQTLPTWLLALALPSPDGVAARLRAQQPAVVSRIEDDRLVFDPRTVLPEQEESLLAAIIAATGGEATS
ncbi:MAG: L-seryl-tRNA(Sec) selenium transferase [Ardenticatenaceae bacterium]|nr:L-seryl-tRNA(Sec) selenium transferase [Ardenticatenaceae bacterium]